MKALIADDSATVRQVLRNHLREWGFEVVLAGNGDEAWEVLQQDDPPSIAVVDLVMPGMDGLELCRRIRRRRQSNYTYVIVLTSRDKKEDIIAAFEAGADDHVRKPFDRDELKYRIKCGQRIIELEKKVIRLASTDFLTGLFNRRCFMERLEAEISRTRRQRTSMSIVITDIDHFKKVNDTWGHQAGDLVLCEFAASLSFLCRPYDFIGRYGGEEFIICLPGATCDQAAAVAERIRAGVETRRIPLTCGSQVRVTSSFGVASLETDTNENVDSLIRRADEALYRAKNTGRNRVCRAC